MDKQVAELIKTLNGGLQHLPDLAKEMVHQYVVGHWVLAGVFLVIACLVAVGMLLFYTKAPHKALYDDYLDEPTVSAVMIGILGSITFFAWLISGIVAAYSACTPIWSIIQSLK